MSIDPRESDLIIDSFEQSWLSGVEPELCDFLRMHGDYDVQRDSNLLLELISIDLEFRWKRGIGSSDDRMLEHYIRFFPELKSSERLIELVVEEYRARRQWSEPPSHTEYQSRFPTLGATLIDGIQQVDRELQIESHDAESMIVGVAPIRHQQDSDAPLIYSDFVLERLIGAGRVGKVYRAQQRSLGRTVAVKYLRKSFWRNKVVVQRFVQEAKTIARLHHPGIVVIHGLGRTPVGSYFIAMEFIDGTDLATVVSRENLVSIADAIDWAYQTCEAIDHAHGRGIVHCDLKPANLMLDSVGRLHVTDFGFARSTVDEHRVETNIEGTAPFMAPEQVSGHWGTIGPHTDVYGIGAILYALLTGIAPNQGQALADILARIISSAPIIAPRDRRTDIPELLDEIIVKSLARRPSDRFQTALEFRDALLNV